jgi:hypothetical protein
MTLRLKNKQTRRGNPIMALSLYDASVANYLQTLGAVSGFLDRGLAHFREHNIDPETIVEARLAPDMLPLRFQIISVAQHSRGAIEGVQQGVFNPPSFKTPFDFGTSGPLRRRAGPLSPDPGGGQCTRRQRRHLRARRPQIAVHGGRLLMSFSLPTSISRDHRLRYPAHQRRSLGQAGFHGPAEDEDLSASGAGAEHNQLNVRH